MKKTTVLLAIATLGIASVAPVFGLQQDRTSTNEYKIKAYKNCTLVLEQPMTSTQIAAYEALQQEAEKMDFNEVGVEGIKQLSNHSLAFYDSCQSTVINNTEDVKTRGVRPFYLSNYYFNAEELKNGSDCSTS